MSDATSVAFNYLESNGWKTFLRQGITLKPETWNKKLYYAVVAFEKSADLFTLRNTNKFEAENVKRHFCFTND
ncbi:hypothetical protein T02_4541 [Trichinella nativa]|uniref:Uncharacterized protein n=1 Tax=Trichinella nativa TaxID=6335 RepID=A0A0V1LEA9_9BILA|nr:hypothetical protein T02_4541 [Trichinella nativa]